jgi:hypothetical protein
LQVEQAMTITTDRTRLWAGTLLATLLCATAAISPAEAETDPEAERPGVRLIGVPAPGHTGPRITIQIQPGDNFMTPDPNAPVETPIAAPQAPAPDTIDETAASAWFWSRVNPALPANAERYWQAEALFADAEQEAQALITAPVACGRDRGCPWPQPSGRNRRHAGLAGLRAGGHRRRKQRAAAMPSAMRARRV